MHASGLQNAFLLLQSRQYSQLNIMLAKYLTVSLDSARGNIFFLISFLRFSSFQKSNFFHWRLATPPHDVV